MGFPKGRVGGEDEFFSPRPGGDGRADDNGESRPDERAMTPRARRKISPTMEERKEEWKES